MKKIGTLFLLIVILAESIFTVKAFSNSTNIKYYVEPTLEYDWDNKAEFHSGLLEVKKDDKWGYIDKFGNEVIPCIYNFIKASDSSDVLIVSDNSNKEGILDKTGKEILPCIYDSIYFSDSPYVSFIYSDYYNLDSNGIVLLPYKYSLYNNEDVFLITQKDNRTSYIYNTGKEIMSFDNTNYSFKGYSDGMTAVEKDGKYGYLDMLGKEVIPCIYDDFTLFYNGVATVRKGTYGEGFETLVIDKQGNILLDYKEEKESPYYRLRYYFSSYFIGKSEKYAVLIKEETDNTYEFLGLNGIKKALVNLNGKEIIPFSKYDILGIDYDMSKDKLHRILTEDYRLLDETGKEIIPAGYTNIKGYTVNTKDYYDRYVVSKDNKWGVYDDNGNQIIPVEYEDPSYMDWYWRHMLWYEPPKFSGNGYITFNKNGKWGALDSNGNVIIPFEFDYGREPLNEENIDYTKERPYYPVFSDEDTIALMKDGKWGVLDNKGNVIVDFIFDDIGNFSEGAAVVELDGKLGIIANPLSNKEQSTEQINAEETYIYDTQMGQSINNEIFKEVQNQTDFNKVIGSLTNEQKQSPSIIDNVTLLAEETISKTASKEVSGDIVIDYNAIEDMQAIALNTKTDIEKIFTQNGISLYRDINTGVEFVSKSQNKINIKFDKSVGRTKAGSTDIDSIKVSTDFAQISLNTNDIYDNIDLTLEKGDNNKVKINFNTDRTTKIKVSLPSIDGNTNYMAVIDESGKAIGGKYNPCNDTLEAKIASSGIYNVLYNEKDFTDIKDKAQAMQEAIKTLASKGIINGTSQAEFSPDSPISRAEVAALIVGILAKLEPNEDGGFIDVNKSNWYFGVAGSSKKYGIISGFPDNTFRADEIIPKEQIISVCARTLKTEMKYKPVANVTNYLNYADKDYISDWAKEDIALATMMDIVLKRTDNKFIPSDKMTRGDAAVVLKRLFDKIW